MTDAERGPRLRPWYRLNLRALAMVLIVLLVLNRVGWITPLATIWSIGVLGGLWFALRFGEWTARLWRWKPERRLTRRLRRGLISLYFVPLVPVTVALIAIAAYFPRYWWLRSLESRGIIVGIGDDPSEHGWPAAYAAFATLQRTVYRRDMVGPIGGIRFGPGSATDRDLDWVGQLPSLQAFSASANPITDRGLQALSHAHALLSLDLSETDVRGPGLAHVPATNLWRLSLVDCDIEADGLRALAHASALGTLDLSYARMRDEDLAPLADHPQLSTLALSRTRITGEGLRPLQKSRLYSMEVRYVQFTDAGWQALGGMRHLTRLDAGGSNIQDRHLQGLAVSDLKLDHTAISDAGLEPLRGNTQLMLLTLTGTSITDRACEILATCPELRILTLDNTRITSAGVSKLQPLTKLIHLSLGGCEVKAGTIVAKDLPTSLSALRIDGLSLETEEALRQELPLCRFLWH